KYRKKRGYVKEVMETNVHKVKQHSVLRDTVRKILRNGKRYVPVVDEANRLTGIVTRASLANIVYDSIWREKELLGYLNIIKEKGMNTWSSYILFLHNTLVNYYLNHEYYYIYSFF